MTQAAQPTPPRVLIVEDDDAQRQTLCDIMRGEGIDTEACANGTDALERVEQGNVSAAIVDLRLPDLDGIQVLERLRTLKNGIRVIIYTAYGSFESAKDAVNLGAFAYVEKLGDPQELIDQVHRAVEERTRRVVPFAKRSRPGGRTRDYVFQLDWKGTIVPDMERLLQRLIGEHIRLETIQPPGIDPVYAEVSQLEQVIMNLVLNARDAMPEGGKLTVETANVEFDESDVAEQPGATPGSYVMVSVSDTGAGMSQDVLDNIFEPYFTTREDAESIGLGLSEVYAIVAKAGGHITVESAPGEGSTFRVYFPTVAAQQE